MSVLNWTGRIERRSLPVLGSKRAFPFAPATSHVILSPSLAGPLAGLSNVVAYVCRLSREEARRSCPAIASGKRAASRRLDLPPAALGLCRTPRRTAQIAPLRCLPNFWGPYTVRKNSRSFRAPFTQYRIVSLPSLLRRRAPSHPPRAHARASCLSPHFVGGKGLCREA